MITIAVGVGENKNILEACDIFKTQKPNVNIELIENDKKLAKSISDKNIDATIRGSLAASNVLKQLKVIPKYQEQHISMGKVMNL